MPSVMSRWSHEADKAGHSFVHWSGRKASTWGYRDWQSAAVTEAGFFEVEFVLDPAPGDVADLVRFVEALELGRLDGDECPAYLAVGVGRTGVRVAVVGVFSLVDARFQMTTGLFQGGLGGGTQISELIQIAKLFELFESGVCNVPAGPGLLAGGALRFQSDAGAADDGDQGETLEDQSERDGPGGERENERPVRQRRPCVGDQGMESAAASGMTPRVPAQDRTAGTRQERRLSTSCAGGGSGRTAGRSTAGESPAE